MKAYSRRILAVAAAAVLSLAVSAPAQAAPGDQQWSCGSVPSGWVVLAYGGICNPVTKANYVFIKQAEGMPAGTSLTVCASSTIPAGWHIAYGPVFQGSCSITWSSTSPNAYIISNS